MHLTLFNQYVLLKKMFIRTIQIEPINYSSVMDFFFKVNILCLLRVRTINFNVCLLIYL